MKKKAKPTDNKIVADLRWLAQCLDDLLAETERRRMAERMPDSVAGIFWNEAEVYLTEAAANCIAVAESTENPEESPPFPTCPEGDVKKTPGELDSEEMCGVFRCREDSPRIVARRGSALSAQELMGFLCGPKYWQTNNLAVMVRGIEAQGFHLREEVVYVVGDEIITYGCSIYRFLEIMSMADIDLPANREFGPMYCEGQFWIGQDLGNGRSIEVWAAIEAINARGRLVLSLHPTVFKRGKLALDLPAKRKRTGKLAGKSVERK